MGKYDLGDKRVLSIMYEGAFYPIGYMTSNAMTESSEMLDVTAREDGGWSTAIPTRQSASISFSGYITNSQIESQKLLYFYIKSLKRDRVKIDWLLSGGTGYIERGQGYINQLDDSAEVESLITFSGNIVVYGKPQTGSDTGLDAYLETYL